MLCTSPRARPLSLPRETTDESPVPVPVCKIAERVSLRQSRKNEETKPKLSPTTQGNILNNNVVPPPPTPTPQPVTAPIHTYTDLIKSLSPTSANPLLTEHLTRRTQADSRISEMEAKIRSQFSDIDIDNEKTSSYIRIPNENEIRLQEFAVERERLQSRIEHLRAQNDVLAINLNDTKTHAHNLTVLLGKYESNNMALHMVVQFR